jgi:hypothetical protein
MGDSLMTLKPLHLSRNDPAAWRTAAAGLVLSALIVGLAIVVGGTTARLLNPIGAVLWLISGVLLAVSLPSVPRQMLGWVAAIAGGFILGALIRPSSLIEVVVWFALAGAVVVVAAADRSGACDLPAGAPADRDRSGHPSQWWGADRSAANGGSRAAGDAAGRGDSGSAGGNGGPSRPVIVWRELIKRSTGHIRPQPHQYDAHDHRLRLPLCALLPAS